MMPAGFRALLGRLTVSGVLEVAFDLSFVVLLVMATTRTHGILQMMAAVAVGLMLIGWFVRARRWLGRKIDNAK